MNEPEMSLLTVWNHKTYWVVAPIEVLVTVIPNDVIVDTVLVIVIVC
jgi:hypothetical protein